MSLAMVLSKKNKITILEINEGLVNKINSNNFVDDKSLTDFFPDNKKLNITATTDYKLAFKDSDFVIIATPTDYDEINNKFDTKSVDEVIKKVLEINSTCLIVIRSTLPVGYTKSLQKLYKTERIIFSPEFLREDRAVYDNLFPSRIVVGGNENETEVFSNLIKDAIQNKDVEILLVKPTEAEAIKLFSNTYLAMRVSFFNELDTYAFSKNLDVKKIINGVCLDERIGEGYNNPSFGYGGYCLPKDTKQLLANYEDVPQTLIQAIVDSNSKRKDFIVEKIKSLKPKVLGIYRLVMKSNSDNYRSSAVLSILKKFEDDDIKIIIFEPTISEKKFLGYEIISEIEEFKKDSELIIANRTSKKLLDVKEKVFSRDLFGIN